MKKSELLKLIEQLDDNASVDEVLSQTDFAKSVLKGGLTLDAFKRDDARARIRVNIRRLLIKYNYPPIKREGAVEQVIKQAELKYQEV